MGVQPAVHVWIVAMLAAGCDGGGPAARSDASPMADVTMPVVPIAIEPPEPPAIPEIGPCVAGYLPIPDGRGCIAPTEPRAPCDAGTARFGIDPTCVAIGDACTSDRFATTLPDGRPVRFVDAAASGGDGTRERPFTRIAEALVDAPPRVVIALAKGTYREDVELPAGVMLRGACAAETRIESETMATSGLVRTAAAGVSVEQVSISPGQRAGVSASGAAASMQLRAVVVDGAANAGVFAVDGARVEARELLVTRTGAGIAVAYAAVLVGPGAEAVLDHVSIVGSDSYGVAISDESRATISDAWIEDTGVAAINLEAGSHATATRVAALRAHGFAIYVRNSELTMSQAIVAGLEPNEVGLSYGGVVVFGESDVTLSRTFVTDNRGRGIAAAMGGHLRLTDTVLCGSSGAGGQRDEGLLVGSGASVVAERVAIERFSHAGIIVDSAESSLELTDAHVSDLVAATGTDYGWGLATQAGAHATIRRARFERISSVGLAALQESTVDVTDLLVREVGNVPSVVSAGAALISGQQSIIAGERIEIANIEGIGVSAGDGGRVQLTEISIDRVVPLACVREACSGASYGTGAAAFYDADIEVSRFRIGAASLCGVQIAGDAALRLTQGRIEGNPIGACVQVAGYDYEKLTREVVYANNVINLDATDLPVPRVAATLDATFELGAP